MKLSMSSPQKHRLIALDSDRRTLHDVCELAKVWYEVMPTYDARQALAWLQNEAQVSIFVTAQVDAAFDGMSLLDKVRTLWPTVRRIVMTDFCDLGRIVGGLHNGVIQKLVQKPLQRHEFLAAIAPTEAQLAQQTPAAKPTRAAG
jgi:DNA-binding NtrC family response regulator